jgi:hypothetical protein
MQSAIQQKKTLNIFLMFPPLVLGDVPRMFFGNHKQVFFLILVAMSPTVVLLQNIFYIQSRDSIIIFLKGFQEKQNAHFDDLRPVAKPDPLAGIFQASQYCC